MVIACLSQQPCDLNIKSCCVVLCLLIIWLFWNENSPRVWWTLMAARPQHTMVFSEWCPTTVVCCMVSVSHCCILRCWHICVHGITRCYLLIMAGRWSVYFKHCPCRYTWSAEGRHHDHSTPAPPAPPRGPGARAWGGGGVSREGRPLTAAWSPITPSTASSCWCNRQIAGKCCSTWKCFEGAHFWLLMAS